MSAHMYPARPTFVVTRVGCTAPDAAIEPSPIRMRRERPATVRVYVTETVMDDVWSSVGRCPGCERTARWAGGERGGALVGGYRVTPAGRRFIVISEAIPALAALSSGTRIEIRAEDWHAIAQRMDTLPGRRLLGWYHSQPGWGVRMSHVDVRTQRTFFHADWQVGLVVDPLTAAWEVYMGRRARPARWLAIAGGDALGWPGDPAPNRRVESVAADAGELRNGEGNTE